MAASNTEVAQAVRTIGGLVANRLVDGLQQSEQSASGNLEESIDPQFTFLPEMMTIDVLMAKYANELDRGRKAGTRPPISAIEKWLTYPNVRDRINLRDRSFKPKELKSLAWAIAKGIEKNGTRGNNFIKNVVNDTRLWDDAAVALAEGAQADIVNEIDTMLARFNK